MSEVSGKHFFQLQLSKGKGNIQPQNHPTKNEIASRDPKQQNDDKKKHPVIYWGKPEVFMYFTY